MNRFSFPVISFAKLVGVFLLFVGCEKIVHGYISDRIFYQVNPFYISQGVTAVSSSLVTDGSTAPLHVSVLSLKDSAGNNADSLLTTPRSIVTYTGTLTYADSTLALLKAKLKDSLVRPFNIAEIGGRLQFTAATKFVPTGTYNLDLSVSNVRGTKVIQNACELIIQPLANTYSLTYRRLAVWDSTQTNRLESHDNDDAYETVEVQHVSGTSISQIIYKWVDKNGVVFSPKKGEISAWSPTTRPTLHSWSPYYPEVYGDSTISLQIPDAGLSLPYFHPVLLPGGATFDDVACRVDYRVYNTTLGNKTIQSLVTMDYFTSGPYYVTVHLNSIVHR